MLDEIPTHICLYLPCLKSGKANGHGEAISCGEDVKTTEIKLGTVSWDKRSGGLD